MRAAASSTRRSTTATAPAWVAARANTLAQWHGWGQFVAMQAQYSLVSRDAERDLLPAAVALGMSVAAWSPLGGGVLSGKFTNAAGLDGPARLSADSISEHDHAVAQVVQEVADELGAGASQVALAWTMNHSKAVHPIVGVRTLDQLTDNLGALDVVLAPEVIARLEAATNFGLGFPHDFIRDMQSFVFGDAGALVDDGITN